MSADNFVWYELVTSDIDAALAFYGELLGWEAREFPGAERRYVIVSAKSKGVGGVMELPEGMSQPFWMGYVGTRDIDAALTRLTGAGGAVHRGPWDIPRRSAGWRS
jgi:predicted enzyme related to lactoylglutathione lyase